MRTFFAIIPVALFLTLATSHCIRSGLQLEDAGYVAMRVADNIRQGNGIVFNPAEKRDLVDSPLWLGFLTVVSYSTHAPWIVQVVGLALGILVVTLVLAGPRLPVAGACASLFLALDGLFAARATGGTSGLLAALYLVMLYIVLRGARARAAEAPHPDGALAGWAAAAALVRYELILVSIPATLRWALGERHRWRAWLPFASAVAGALVVLVLRGAYFHAWPAFWEPWPPSVVGFETAARTLGELAMRRPLLGLGILVMLAGWVRGRFRVGRSAGITWGMFLLAAFSLLPAAGHDVERQLEVVLPLAYLLAVDAVWRGARTRLGLVAALLLVAAQPAWTWTVRTSSPESRAAYARLGQWLQTHAIPGTVVGARQVGALGYFSGLQVEDVLGQVSPRVAASRRQMMPAPYAVAAFDFAPMLRQEPDLVLVGATEPAPSAILYVPNLDAVPIAVRGDYGVYRWAGSPVWHDASRVTSATTTGTR